MNRFRQILVLASVTFCLPFYALAQTEEEPIVASDSIRCIVDAINAEGNIYIVQPEALTHLMVRKNHGVGNDAEQQTTVVATRNGYRVQVFDDNNPGTARARAEAQRDRMEAAFPQWRTYVTFNSPYWQVRVGDFKRRGEAEAALAMIRDAMPALAAYARIVPEKINITE